MPRVLLALTAAAMMVGMVSCANGPDGDSGDARGAGDAAPHDAAAGGATTADAEAVRRAVEATAAVDRARVELQTVYSRLAGSGDVPAGLGDVRTAQRAAFDRPAGRIRAESDMSELAEVLEGTDESVPGDYSLPTRFVIDGDTVYAQIGPMARSVGLEPTSWIKRDLAGFAHQSIDNETAALLLDPLGMLGLLARPVTDVRSVGYDHIRGVATTHLTATVDLRPRPAPTAAPSPDAPPGAGPADRSGAAPDVPSGADPGTPLLNGSNGSSPSGGPSDESASPGDAAGEGLAAEDEAAGGELEARFRAIGVDELPVDLYIDDDHIIRRIEFHLDARGAGGGPGHGGLTTTFDVYDVGDPIEIPVPDPADVVDPADLHPRSDP